MATSTVTGGASLPAMTDQEQQDILQIFSALSGNRRRTGPRPGFNGDGTRTKESLLSMPHREDLEEVSIGFKPSEVMGGPAVGMTPDQAVEVMIEDRYHSRRGEMHVYWMKCQDEIAAKDPELAKDPRGINFVLPRVMSSADHEDFLTEVVILANADDCEKVARRHIKKQPNFTPIFAQSLIATTDNEHWAKQRNHLQEVFLPKKSLAKIFERSLARAETCADKLDDLAKEAGKYGVQMHDFFLHEAQAQLQLALFGMDEEFMESTNRPVRDGFAGRSKDPAVIPRVTLQMMRQVSKNDEFASPSDPDVLSGDKPVFGPLSKSVDNAEKQLGLSLPDQFGNMLLILFAGHDTTAHTMTWMTYELANHPEHQARLHQEVDAFFDRLERLGRPMKYEDCEHLPFLTRCVMETLRLWTAVPNGTFRELQYDEFVKGPNGKDVKLKKGTYVQVTNIMRHWNKELWGEDAMEWNPNRDFQGDEIWGGESFKAYNPSSARFSPFTFAPRDCLGKNFAQMEMRTIIANVFRRFKFTLSEPYAKWNRERDGPLENAGGTMGPRDLTPEGLAKTQERLKTAGRGPVMAMYLNVEPRTPNPPAAKL